MCGIVGYTGPKTPGDVLLSGLRKLEYRGYDSAGVAIFNGPRIKICRCEGKIVNLEKNLSGEIFDGNIGIGHTRWATHGRPSEANAHPHIYQDIAVVHNGIIENYVELKDMLKAEGDAFSSETDSEVLSHLFARFTNRGMSFEDAVCRGLKMVRGSYAIAVLYEKEPTKIIAARKESPLIVGLGNGENFVASDVPAILEYTRNMLFLNDEEYAVLSENSIEIKTLEGNPVERSPSYISWDPIMAEKGGYKHFMLKEIFEQPRAIIDTLRGRISEDTGDVFLDGVQIDAEYLNTVERVYFIACGTSYYAGLVGKFMLEKLGRISTEVDLASEFRYRNPLVDKKTLIVLISQSGETADTLAAMKEAKAKGARVICICNVVESTLARDCDYVLYTHAGPEIGVASTKAFTSQLTALFLIAIYIGRIKITLKDDTAKQLIKKIVELPHLLEKVLELEPEIKEIAKTYADASNFLFLGRGINYPIALEGALKLKEISYIHAEGYPAGEMKHGPIALIDENMPVLCLVPADSVYEKIISNIEEVKARKGSVIAIGTDGDTSIVKKVDHSILVPLTDSVLMPFVMVVPLQLFAYHVAVFNGTDVDQPRNLAKSVTVE